MLLPKYSVHILARLVECALKIAVSIPDVDRTDLSLLTMVVLDAGPCRFVDTKRTVGSFAESELLDFLLFSTHAWGVETGQMFLFPVRVGKSILLEAYQVGTS